MLKKFRKSVFRLIDNNATPNRPHRQAALETATRPNRIIEIVQDCPLVKFMKFCSRSYPSIFIARVCTPLLCAGQL